MKSFILAIVALFFLGEAGALAQLPPGSMYGRCSNIYGPIYSTSTQSYSASGACQNRNPVNCRTDPLDDTPDYHCTTNGGEGQDPNPSVAADEACGCMDT
ncbi:MAG TPA: hypothetical protein DF383_04665 [Deltaproteobacteria bacterium]|nr:hypothetical protein [Deltaproteobacteria bacterium]